MCLPLTAIIAATALGFGLLHHQFEPHAFNRLLQVGGCALRIVVVTLATFMARLTLTSATPATERSALSTCAEHEAQLMPFTGYVWVITDIMYTYIYSVDESLG